MIGMSEVTANYGYDIVVSLITSDDHSALKRIIDNHKVDGFVLTRTLVDDKPSQYLKEAGIPFVAVGPTTDEDVVTVDNDNFGACKELTSVLIAKGLKKLAIIGGSTEHIITKTRLEAFMAAFEEAGLTVDPSLVCLDCEKAQKIGNALMELVKKDIDGVVCMDDNVANAVMAKCRAEHIKIPDDIRIASFYNSSILENAIPSVTSLNFDERNLGAVAARMLLEMIDGEKVASRTLKNYEVILKESTK